MASLLQNNIKKSVTRSKQIFSETFFPTAMEKNTVMNNFCNHEKQGSAGLETDGSLYMYFKKGNLHKCTQ